MRDRRGSAMYDAARDIFTKPDDNPPEAAENAIESDPVEPAPNDVDQPPASPVPVSPGSKKRKRSRSPEHRRPTVSPAPAEPAQQSGNLPSTRPQPSPHLSAKSPLAQPKQDSPPKAMTAANLASIPRAKKMTNKNVDGGAKDHGKSRLNRRRSRSPVNDSAYSRRRDRSPPPRRRTPSPAPIPRSPTPPPRSPPRQRRRPGATARVSAADTEAVRQRQLEREQQQNDIAQAEAVARGVHDVVRQHYNAVPQRGKEWRKTDSLIKGLRSLNNWVKSAVIQKFSPDESFTPGAREHGYNRENDDQGGLLVLDIGCGKGGDLQKWHAAPQRIELYVGLDPAEVSINQARDRHSSMRRGGGRGSRDRRSLFQAEFNVKDCYGEWIGDIPIVQDVGIDPSVGPDGRGPKRYRGGGFDVVTMMFCMHYAFENEAKARMMLRNVAGSLKKGGRFVGVIPNSDILTAKVTEYNASRGFKPAPATEEADSDDDWDPERTLDSKQQKDASPQNSASDNPPASTQENGTVGATGSPKDLASSTSASDTLTWGNTLYSIKFPNPSRAPADGVFRPPFGWKYFYFLEEAVEEIPEYVVPWEAFRALALEYDLELQYKKPFNEVWEAEKDDPILGPLSERMGVRDRFTGELSVTEQEVEAAGFYLAFCFYKVGT